MSNNLLKRFKLFTDALSSGGGGIGAVWGAITGTLSDQTDLQDALDTKADQSQVDALQGDVDTLIIDVTNLEGAITTLQSDVAAIEAIIDVNSGSINIDFGVSGDFLTTTVSAPWVTSGHYGKIKCEVIDDGTDHLAGEAALGCVLASVNNIVAGVSFDIIVVSQHDTWGRYTIKYNEII
jgi:hypothetical protein